MKPIQSGIEKKYVFGHGNILKMLNTINSYLRDILVSKQDIVKITITVIEKEG